jgi:hypothetical protein
MSRRPGWDERCTDILRTHAGRCTNARIVELIEGATGQRFSVYAVSRRRSALGIHGPQRNDWTSPLRRWRPWQ